MKMRNIIAIVASIALGVLGAKGGGVTYTSGGQNTLSMNDSWSPSGIPSGAFAQTYVWGWLYTGSRVQGQGGLAGPPSGLVYLAQIDSSSSAAGGVGDYQSSTLAGGSYSVWHVGSVTGGTGGVKAETVISW
jgi:hypothetical protein